MSVDIDEMKRADDAIKMCRINATPVEELSDKDLIKDMLCGVSSFTLKLKEIIMNYDTTVMYGPNFQPNFKFPDDYERWYENLPTFPIDIPAPYQKPQRSIEDLQRDIENLTQRILYLEQLIAGDGK